MGAGGPARVEAGDAVHDVFGNSVAGQVEDAAADLEDLFGAGEVDAGGVGDPDLADHTPPADDLLVAVVRAAGDRFGHAGGDGFQTGVASCP